MLVYQRVVFVLGLLVGGLEHGWILTFHILGILIATDYIIFFKGVQTTNQVHLLVFIKHFCNRIEHRSSKFKFAPMEDKFPEMLSCF